MSLTGYEQVGIFHEVFGHPTTKQLQTNIFDDNPKLVKFRLSLIEEEKNELKEACEKKDFIEAIDAISDTLFVTYGMCHVFGIDYKKDDDMPHLECLNINFTNLENWNSLSLKEKISATCEARKKGVPNLFVFDEYDEKLNKLLDTLENNVSTLKQHCDEKNMNEVMSDIHTIVCTCYTTASLFGVNIDKCFDEVYRSNMTKVCSSEDEAKETVEWYKQNEKRYTDPSYKQSANQKYWIVFDGVTSKILKSIKFELPNLQDVIFGSLDTNEPEKMLRITTNRFT